MHACVCQALRPCPTVILEDQESPGSSVHGTQVRMLEWVVMTSSKRSSHPGIKPALLMSPASAGGCSTTSATWKSPKSGYKVAKKIRKHLMSFPPSVTGRSLATRMPGPHSGPGRMVWLHAERHCPQTSLFSVPLRKARLVDLESAHPQDTAQCCFLESPLGHPTHAVALASESSWDLNHCRGRTPLGMEALLLSP